MTSKGPAWSNYVCNQCLPPLKLFVRTPVHSEVYSIQHVIKLGSDLQHVGGGGFPGYCGFPLQIKLTATI